MGNKFFKAVAAACFVVSTLLGSIKLLIVMITSDNPTLWALVRGGVSKGDHRVEIDLLIGLVAMTIIFSIAGLDGRREGRSA